MKGDTLDRARWRAMLWKREPVPADPDPPPADPAPADPAPAPAIDEAPPAPVRAELDDEYFAELARWADELWTSPARELRRDEVDRLVRKSLDLFRYSRFASLHPAATVRALRLAVWLWPTLAEYERTILYGVGAIPTAPPEFADLLCEAAALGDRTLAYLLDRALPEGDLRARHPALGERLSRIASGAKRWNSREIALAWLCSGTWPEARACLRAALRWPNIRCRLIALSQLRSAGALQADEVAWLLADAVVHPIDGDPYAHRADDMRREYQDELTAAVEALRPAGGLEPLARIVRWECAVIRRDRRYLDPAWALEVLARAWPERALPHVDAILAQPESLARYGLVRAVAALPEEQARPRLLALAGDVAHLVSSTARDAWLARFGTACPASALAGVPTEWLDAPPGPAFESRVLVLRCGEREAHVKMLEAVHAGPPSREALVLTLFALRAIGSYFQPPLPTDHQAWCASLRERYGVVAVRAMIAEARRGHEGWFSPLRELARQGELGPEELDALAMAVEERLRAPLAELSPAALSSLDVVRVSEEIVGLLWERLATSLHPSERSSIAFALRRIGPSATLDAQLGPAFDGAVMEGKWERVAELGALGLARGHRGVTAGARALVWDRDEPEAERALRTLAYALRDHGAWTEADLLAALGEPDAARFGRIARVLRGRDPRPAAVEERLLAALDSLVRGGDSAGAALATLMQLERLDRDDPRFERVYWRCGGRLRMELLEMALHRYEGDRARYAAHLRDGLCSRDESVAREALEIVLTYDRGRWDEAWLEQVCAEMPKGDVRAVLYEHLGYASEAESYWREDGEED